MSRHPFDIALEELRDGDYVLSAEELRLASKFFHAGWMARGELDVSDEERIEPKKRPTIAELDAILNAPEQPNIRVMPDGSVSAIRSCNRHSDCAKADIEAKARGAFAASHCHDDCCEDCFGN
jgi:hypothetical protein